MSRHPPETAAKPAALTRYCAESTRSPFAIQRGTQVKKAREAILNITFEKNTRKKGKSMVP